MEIDHDDHDAAFEDSNASNASMPRLLLPLQPPADWEGFGWFQDHGKPTINRPE
jgi:hypothetical protein